MMILLARILATLAALFGIVLGLGFLVHPVNAGAMFFLSPNGIPGLAVLRADMTAFFLAGGVLSAAAAWRRDPNLLIAPILILIGAAGLALGKKFDEADFAVVELGTPRCEGARCGSIDVVRRILDRWIWAWVSVHS